MKVYQAINAVQAELAREGISKDRKNAQQGYNFRGIDDVYNALAPLLAKHGLCVLPRCTSREVVERVNKNQTALFYVTVCAEFDFVCAEDGSKHTVGPMYGEAMDSGDKATNKAMSAAYKYAAMQAFAIPTEGDNDADATTHEVQPSDFRGPDRVETPQHGIDRASWESVTAIWGEDLKLIAENLDAGDYDAAYAIYAAIPADAVRVVWKAPTKVKEAGITPIFSTANIAAAKSNEWSAARVRYLESKKEPA